MQKCLLVIIVVTIDNHLPTYKLTSIAKVIEVFTYIIRNFFHLIYETTPIFLINELYGPKN